MKKTLITAIALTFMASGAFAHAAAEKTTPANEATVETVDVIEMRFDNPMRVIAITVAGPDGEVAIDRETGMDAVTEFRAVPSEDLIAGSYSVDWRALSPDGHPMQGNFSFDVEG